MGLFKYVSLACLILYMVGYCISIGTLFWLIISEIYSLKIRSIGMSFVAGIQWLANFVVSMTFLPILHALGGWTFAIYGTMCLLALLFVIFYVPETRGVPLELIERNLEEGRPVLELGMAD
jgi:hypothetical protein